jgi:hypothetical protein
MGAEIVGLGGSAILGFIFKFISNMQQDSYKAKMAMLGAVEESKVAASERGGAWIRRFIVVVLLSILAITATGLGATPTNIVTTSPETSILWGLFSIDGVTRVTEIVGGMYDETIRISILSIIGYYFGTSTAER